MSALIFLPYLLNVIINEYFQHSRCLFIISENFEDLEYKGVIPIVNINPYNETLEDYMIFQRYGCQEIIIHHKQFSSVLVQFENKIKMHSDRFNYRKYLIVPIENASEDATKLFDLSVLQYIVNILIIKSSEATTVEECESKFKIFRCNNEIYELLTNKYVGIDKNNDPRLLDIWFSNNKSYMNNNDLYPDKIKNQQGRILRCATFNYKPYSIIVKSPDMARGSENNVAHEYARRHNMTIKYIKDDDEWGIIYDNWTGNGILGNVATDKADVGYGALYTWAHEYGFLDLSKPVVRTGITCLVPAPQLASGWATPVLPFSSSMWIGVAISFVVSAFVTIVMAALISKMNLQNSAENVKSSFVNYRLIFHQSLLRITRIFLIQSVPTLNTNVDSALRYLSILFLFALLMTSSYSSGLATIMTIPRYTGAIHTVNDLANSGLNWGATQDAWIFSIMDEERPQYVTLVDKFIATPEENLIQLSKTNKFAFSIERLPSGQYAIGSYITEDVVRKLRLLQEDLYWEYCLFMIRKNSPLLDSLDTMILHLNEIGIIHFWEMKAAQIHMDLRVQNIVRYYSMLQKEENEGTVKLQWIHVEGTFGILVMGFVVSTIVFIIEVFYF